MPRYCSDVQINCKHNIPRILLIGQNESHDYEVYITPNCCIITDIKNDQIIFASNHFIIIDDKNLL